VGTERPHKDEIFNAAAEITDVDKRASYIAEACGDDSELRAEIEELLRHDNAEYSLLDRSAPGFGATLDQPVTEKLGAQIGPYKLLQMLGQGGMGEVWVAKQSEPVKRKVALKLIKPGMDSRAVLQRFEQERQALAMMDHPNIAKVLDAGMTPNGQPFFVMELVNGLPLNKFCDELKLKPKERLQLFVPICQAVQHAHQKGIVHRDLKPANILITMIDTKPVPKVIDFGVAKATAGKLTDESMSTQFGAVVGTLEYMSPEQAGFSGEDIDTRADIYSLGVILYELLTGLRPIDAARLKKAALTEMLRIIREDEPSKPSTRLSTDASLPSLAAMRQTDPRKLMAILRGDLDWVVMKCLEKHRERRYETANALARDIQRYLNGDAVEACPPSVGYRMGKFLKRNKGKVLAASFVLLSLVAGLIGTAWGLFHADRARQAEAAQRKIAVEEKKKADTREELAIDAVKKFRDAVANNPELKNNPALESLRKALLKEPLAFFKALRDRLQADRDTRPESLARLAAASHDLGWLTDEIGDKEDALIAFRESLAILQKLADANPAVTRFQHDLASTHGNIAKLLNATGKPGEALKADESALAIFQKLADNNPTATDFQSALARTHNNIGALMKEIGKPDGALKAFESALAIFQKLVDANPTSTDFQHQLAVSHENVGIVLRETGKPSEALKAHKLAFAIFQKLADTKPSATEFQSELATSHNRLGALLKDTGKPGEALKAHESALAILQRLADANPTSTNFQRNLAESHHYIGILLSATGKPDEALKAHKSALVILQKLTDANPTVTQFQSDLAASHVNLGLLLKRTGKPGDALKAYKSALAIVQKLADANPTVTNFQRLLAESHNRICALLKDTGKPGEALKAYESALASFQKLADANPAVTRFQHDLASTHNNAGALLTATGKPGEALKAHESALAIFQKLTDANPTATDLQHNLAASHTHVGDLLSDTGKPAEAMKAYELALPIRERLARDHPEAPDYAGELGGLLNNIAKIDLDAKRFDPARDRLQEAIVWQKKALAVNPADPKYRQFLANHLTNLNIAALGLGNTGKPAEAMKAYELALPIREQLAREHPESPDYACDLGGLLNNIARIDLDARRFDEARNRLQQAIVWQTKALAVNPANPKFRKFLANHLTNLIKASRGLGDSEGLAEAERELAKLRDSDPVMLALDTRLSAIIKGAQQPEDGADRLRLAQRAYDKAMHATAARLWAEALAADPKLGDNRQTQHRYNAACAAAMAGCGKGKDDPSPDEAAKAKLRKQALDWLRAELSDWKRVSIIVEPGNKELVAKTLAHWEQDTDLASIHDTQELAKLPDEERAALKQLWNDVDALLTEVGNRK